MEQTELKTYANDSIEHLCNVDEKWLEGHHGLSKREYFAAKAFQALISNTKYTDHLADTLKQSKRESHTTISEDAVLLADSLIEALNQ